MWCSAQFATYNPQMMKRESEKLKNATLYIAIDQNANEKNEQYVKIIEEYWKYSKVEVIDPNEFMNYLKEGNFFLSLTVMYDIGFDFNKPAAFQYFTYDLWTPDPDFLKKMQKKHKPNMLKDYRNLAQILSSIALIFDKSESFTIDDVMKGEYFGNGIPLYSGPGIFKNYIQAFQMYLNNKEGYSKTVINKAEIKKLKKSILYVPSTFLVDNSGITFNNYKKNKKTALNAEEIFADYTPKYKEISLKELNDKILNSDEPIYYISKPATNRVVVINSQTGEFIFAHYIDDTDKISKGNLKKLVNCMEDDR